MNPQKPNRTMSDLGPRRSTSNTASVRTPRPVSQSPVVKATDPTPVVTQPGILQDSIPPAPVQAPLPVEKPVASYDQFTSRPISKNAAPARKKPLKLILQALLGFIVIIAVAAAIVYVYIQFYRP